MSTASTAYLPTVETAAKRFYSSFLLSIIIKITGNYLLAEDLRRTKIKQNSKTNKQANKQKNPIGVDISYLET